MSSKKTEVQHTQHAFLAAWGWFAEHLGLIPQIEAVPLKQKRYTYTPQIKVIEFMVAILAGSQHLQEISLAAHPLDRDLAVAQAWGQPSWADYSGVSRTLRGLSWGEADQIAKVLEQISRLIIEAELQSLRTSGERICYDGDLTEIPVSNTSQTYPNAAYGHMNDEIRLGYQAALVSLESPTYGRLWLSSAHHPGDTVSCTQAEAVILAAKARKGQRPQRRTELLNSRMRAFEQHIAQTTARLETQKRLVQDARDRLTETEQQLLDQQQQLEELEGLYQIRGLQERPTSRLAQTRQRCQTVENRLKRRERACQKAQHRLEKTRSRWEGQHAELSFLQQRLTHFEQDNAANPDPIAAEFRLDAGFGTYENLTLLIEMGNELYTKPHSHRVVTYLRREVDDQTAWIRVGANAKLVVWPGQQFKGYPYPLDVALERFYTGKSRKHIALIHIGSDPVADNPPAWFAHYNRRQIIEAGIKESKQVFYLHRLKVRSEAAIYLLECFVIFAANFIRWAAHWLSNQAQSAENGLNVSQLGVKRQVQVAAHVSAQVIRSSEEKLLMFSEQHAMLVDMLTYKAELAGIQVVLQEESYTSRCSFLDGEFPEKREVYAGKRIKRGLFRAADGRLINADVNAAYNIITKAFPKAIEGIEGVLVVHPVRVMLSQTE